VECFNSLEFVLYLSLTFKFHFPCLFGFGFFHYISRDQLLSIYMCISKCDLLGKTLCFNMDTNLEIFIIKYNIHHSSIRRSLHEPV
jgi:hypothetical protein